MKLHAYKAEKGYDAVDLIEVDYEALDVTLDPQRAMQAGAPQLHADIPNNLAFQWTVAGGDVDAAFAQAEDGYTSLFDGKTFAGWKPAEEKTNTWSVQDGAHVAHGAQRGIAQQLIIRIRQRL